MTHEQLVEEEWKTDLRKEYRKKTLSMAKEVYATGTYEKVEGMICDWWFDKLTTTAQRAKADWLRSEIERVEGEKRPTLSRGEDLSDDDVWNDCITYIITPWKEELAELESK